MVVMGTPPRTLETAPMVARPAADADRWRARAGEPRRQWRSPARRRSRRAAAGRQRRATGFAGRLQACRQRGTGCRAASRAPALDLGAPDLGARVKAADWRA